MAIVRPSEAKDHRVGRGAVLARPSARLLSDAYRPLSFSCHAMIQRLRPIAAISFLWLLLAAGSLDAIATGCSAWLHQVLSLELTEERSGCGNPACRCPKGECRMGPRCGCGSTTAGGGATLGRWRIRCHEPFSLPGIYQPAPRIPVLLAAGMALVLHPRLTEIHHLTPYCFSPVFHSSTPETPPPR